MSESFDRELSLKSLLLFGVALVVLILVSAGAMWVLSDALKARLEAQDPPPPLLPEARAPYEPPEPRLQSQPERDLVALRAEEEEILGSYGWVDEAGGTVRVPIERAIELLAEEERP